MNMLLWFFFRLFQGMSRGGTIHPKCSTPKKHSRVPSSWDPQGLLLSIWIWSIRYIPKKTVSRWQSQHSPVKCRDASVPGGKWLDPICQLRLLPTISCFQRIGSTEQRDFFLVWSPWFLWECTNCVRPISIIFHPFPRLQVGLRWEADGSIQIN